MTTIMICSGALVPLENPDASMVQPQDIVASLANLCRFTGHTSRFYSVAQHCLVVAALVRPELSVSALLHDATEAYLGDVAAPLKALLPQYKTLENRWEQAIAQRFNTARPSHIDDVLFANQVARALEAQELMPSHEWFTRAVRIVPPGYLADAKKIVRQKLSPSRAEAALAAAFRRYALL